MRQAANRRRQVGRAWQSKKSDGSHAETSQGVRPGFTSCTELLEQLEPIALGELRMAPKEFANATIGEIDSLVSGYVRRYQRLEDLFIIHCALPAYRGAYGKKAPTYEQLTAHRHQANGKVLQMDAKTEAYWREILNEGVKNVEKS